MSFLNSFSIMKGICLFSLILCAGCGPGAKDGSMHISHGYYFSHLGGDQNLIEYITNDESKIVIKSKVEDFILHKDKIYVSRRPVIYQKNNEILSNTLSKKCEYWIIDLTDNRVEGPIKKKEIRQLIKDCKWLKP